MIDGIYSIAFRGVADWGMGLLILRHGIVSGADIGGVLYDGNFKEDGDTIQISLTLRIPPGVTLVQGTTPQAKEYTLTMDTTVPKTVMELSEPHLVTTPIGPVNVIFRKLRDLAE